MKKLLAIVLVFHLILAMIPAMAEGIAVQGSVTEIEKYGHALLDITIEDFEIVHYSPLKPQLKFELGI